MQVALSHVMLLMHQMYSLRVVYATQSKHFVLAISNNAYFSQYGCEVDPEADQPSELASC